MSFGKNRNIERTIEFKKIVEALMLRAKGDNVDSIRVLSSSSLRDIIQLF